MKYIGQFTVIIFITFLGEIMHALIPLPVPASIYGMLLMLLCLCVKVVPLSAVDEAGSFLVEIMPVMFIPAGVGLITAWGELRAMLIPALIAVLPLTALVMGVSGKSAQLVIDFERRKRS